VQAAELQRGLADIVTHFRDEHNAHADCWAALDRLFEAYHGKLCAHMSNSPLPQVSAQAEVKASIVGPSACKPSEPLLAYCWRRATTHAVPSCSLLLTLIHASSCDGDYAELNADERAGMEQSMLTACLPFTVEQTEAHEPMRDALSPSAAPCAEVLAADSAACVGRRCVVAACVSAEPHLSGGAACGVRLFLAPSRPEAPAPGAQGKPELLLGAVGTTPAAAALLGGCAGYGVARRGAGALSHLTVLARRWVAREEKVAGGTLLTSPDR
jgi:hypothetical protein